MREHAREPGIDPHRLAAGGGSAAGHVAVCTAVVSGDDGAAGNSRSADAHHQASPDRHAKSLEKLIERLEQTGARLIFATTTPVPDRPEGPLRHAKNVLEYNRIAREIMKAHGITINDLYTFIAPRPAELQRPNNVHFTADGSAALAREVVRSIRKYLEKES